MTTNACSRSSSSCKSLNAWVIKFNPNLQLKCLSCAIATYIHKGRLQKYVLPDLLTCQHVQILMYNYLLHICTPCIQD